MKNHSMDLFDLTVHKSNKLIRGGSPWSLNGRKAADAIYHYVQKYNLLEKGEIEIPIKMMREMMGLNRTNRYGEIIRASLRELAQPIFIQGADPARKINKSKIKWDTVYFILKPHEMITDDARSSVIRFELSDTARLLISDSKNENFTQLILKDMTKFRTAYGHAIYQYILSWENKTNRIHLDLERLQIMLSRNSKRYKYFSSFKPLVEKAVKEIREKTKFKNLTVTIDKKNKIFWLFTNMISDAENSEQSVNEQKKKKPSDIVREIQERERMKKRMEDGSILVDAI